MAELPEEEIEAAEERSAAPAHGHAGVTAEDGTLAEHLRAVHGLDVEAGTSPATLEGLHDRLHDSSKAADA
ncbi:MAG: hypothetical protein ACRD0N_10690 [Acidimicrobiales bacterium]